MSDRPIVLLTNSLHPSAEALLASHATLVTAPDTQPDTLRSLAADAHGIIVRTQLPEDILDYAPCLKGIVRHGVGLDFIPVGAATARGIPVANLPGVNAQAVTEYCFSALLQLRRPLSLMDDTLRCESWHTARAMASETSELSGTTLGIVGVGNVGRRLAEAGRLGFGMTVLGTSRQRGRMPDGIEEVALDELFLRSDAIVLACPLTNETRGLVNADRLSLMKADAVLINISRGPVVTTEALIAALQSEAIAGAVIDVFDIEPLPPGDVLLRCPRLLLTPHVAAVTSPSLRKMSIGAAEEMIRILSSNVPANLANPDCLAYKTLS